MTEQAVRLQIFKRIAAILTCLTLVLLLLCSCVASDNYANNRNRAVNAVNHRGYFTAPENTLAAFSLSKQMGFDMVECDVRFTSDNVAVLLHDRTVNRTSNGHGRINRMTLEQARKLDFGSWKGSHFTNECIPTFEEFIDLCVELELHPYVEVKNGATLQQVLSLAATVVDANMSVTWIARDVDYLTELHKHRPDDRLGLLVDVITSKAVQSILQIDKNLTFIDANYLFLTRSQIRLCKHNNVPLEIWTVNNRYTITHIDTYVSGITSNKYNAQELFDNIYLIDNATEFYPNCVA